MNRSQSAFRHSRGYYSGADPGIGNGSYEPFFVTGLDKENFKLTEDKVDQEITQFSSEDAPLSVGIVFDTSGSMGAKLQRSRQAVAQFMKTANPQDEFSWWSSVTGLNWCKVSRWRPKRFRTV